MDAKTVAMSSAEVPMTNLSERLADGLRRGDSDSVWADSPWAACLLPLLKALGWHNYARELIEALPHFADDVDLVDLRNTLVNLGYESEPRRARMDRMSPALMPCLFVADSGDIFVLIEQRGDGIHYYDARSHEYCTKQLERRPGVAYCFTDVHTTHAVSASPLAGRDWFSNLLHRFRGLIVHLLAMTGLLNLIALVIPLFIMLVFDKIVGTKTLDSLPYLVAGISIVLIVDFALRNLRARLLGSVAGRLDYLIGVETFRRLLLLPPTLTERSTVQAQLSRLKQFDSVRDFLSGPYASVALELPFVVLFIAVIGLIGGSLALIPAAMVGAFVLLGLAWLPVLNRRVSRAAAARTDKQRMLLQTFAGRRELKAHGASRDWLERFREVSGEVAMAGYRAATAGAVLNTLAQAIMTLSGTAVLAFGTHRVINGEMSIGVLIASMALVWRVLSPLQSAFLAFTRVHQVVKGVRQINQLMRISPEHRSGASSLLSTTRSGKLTVDRVSFRYGPDQDPAVLGASFVAKAGELVAVAGETGSGKSTLLKLIAGMYRPQAGAVLMDDGDIRQLNPMDLRRSIGYVPQVPKLFYGSIAQNLRLNNVLATEEELREAARQAGVLETIEKLPEGFETRIGDRDSERLPPGFAHGLCLARALARPTRLLLLDEPGSSLDWASDQNLMRQLRQIRGSKTVFVVTHRPSHMRLADRVVLMERGQIRYVGRPEKAIRLLLGE